MEKPEPVRPPLPVFRDALDTLRRVGLRIALDDVGLGHANYRMVLECRPDYLKVDRFFVKGVHADFYRDAVLESICHLAHRIGARVVAEGVDDDADLTALRALRFDLAQGYLPSAPQPVSAAPGTGMPFEAGALSRWFSS